MDSEMADHHSARPVAMPRMAPMMTWVEVADPTGRTRLEARWSVPAAAEAGTTVAHAA